MTRARRGFPSPTSFVWTHHLALAAGLAFTVVTGCVLVDGDGEDGDGADAGDGDGDGDSDVPDTAYCAPVAGVDEEWAAFEAEVLVLVNEARAAGQNCDSAGVFSPTGPLTAHSALRCSARVHSRDMAINDYFDHDSQDGTSPGARIEAAGYDGYTWGENIAAGYATPEAVVAGWIESDGHCSNLMNPDFEHLGVGYWVGGGYGHVWTQNFGAGG